MGTMQLPQARHRATPLRGRQLQPPQPVEVQLRRVTPGISQGSEQVINLPRQVFIHTRQISCDLMR